MVRQGGVSVSAVVRNLATEPRRALVAIQFVGKLQFSGYGSRKAAVLFVDFPDRSVLVNQPARLYQNI